jgi:acetylornithine deacetylase/succinyl-diaminopimelate desuccinylase-like protein
MVSTPANHMPIGALDCSGSGCHTTKNVNPGGFKLGSASISAPTLNVAGHTTVATAVSGCQTCHETALYVGMLGGSEVVNAKAADAWFTVDLRSTSNEVIADLEKKVALILREEATREGMTVKTDLISASPAALIPGHRNSPLVRISEAVHLAMGFINPPITETGSNNSSAALLAGIPSISTGAGPCGDSHALTEWCSIEPFYNGTKKIILLELALAEISDQ